MSIFYNEKLNTAIKLLCMAIAVGLLIIAKVVYEADMLSLAIYVGFAIFYVQLPGLFMLRLFRLNFDRLCTRLCAGFFTGWTFVVLQYFICEGIHSNLILYALGPIGSIAYIVMAVLSRAKARDGQATTAELKGSCCPAKKFKNLSTAFCIFTLLVFAYAMLSTQLQYINPAYCATTYMNPDKAYHMGLIDSLSHGWPLESPWVKGRVIKYHIFTELLMAVPVRLFAVPSDVAIFSFNPLMTTYVLCISTYTMFREFTRKSNRAGLYCLSIILANMFLVRTPHTSMAFHFVIINDNAVGYGVSCFMFALVLFKLWYDKIVENSAKARSNMGYLLLLVAMVMLMTGIKGPIGIVFVGAIWGTAIIGIVLRKIPLKTIIPVILMSVGFIIVYMTIMSGKGAANGSGESIFAFATIANIAFYRSALVGILKGMGIPKILRLGIMLVVFMTFMLTAYIVPFVVGYIRELVLVFAGKKEYYFPRVLAYAAFLVGIAAMFIMNYSGHSQVYFGFAPIFLTPLITFWFFEDMEQKPKAYVKLIKVIFFLGIILTSFTLVLQFESMIRSAAESADRTVEHKVHLSITNEEYEAMKWIEENTPKDALLATDRYYSVPLEDYSYENRWDNRFFLYANYSNRFCYIAGSGYNFSSKEWTKRRDMIEINKKLYDSANANRAELAEDLGVSYVVLSKRFTDGSGLEGDGYKLVFSSDQVDVFEVKSR